MSKQDARRNPRSLLRGFSIGSRFVKAVEKGINRLDYTDTVNFLDIGYTLLLIFTVYL